MIDNEVLYFLVESTLEEIKDALLNYIESTNGKLKKNENDEIIASYGSQIEALFFGTILGGINNFPRDVIVNLKKLGNEIAVQINIIDAFAFGSTKRTENKLRKLFNDQATDIKLNIEEIVEQSKQIVKSDSFISELNKVYNLKLNGVYSDDEFTTRKNGIFTKLKNYGINENTDDFLVNLIPLKENGILSFEDITLIKSILVTKENVLDAENDINKNVEKSNSDFRYYCNICKSEMELEPDEINNKKFVCPNCGTLNNL